MQTSWNENDLKLDYGDDCTPQQIYFLKKLDWALKVGEFYGRWIVSQ